MMCLRHGPHLPAARRTSHKKTVRLPLTGTGPLLT